MDADKTLEEICRESRLRDAERAIVLDRLKQLGGNKMQTARSLGISVRTLQRSLISWGVVKEWAAYPANY